MDLGSAKNDRKRILTVAAVNTAFASSEWSRKKRESQFVFSITLELYPDSPLSSPPKQCVPPLSTTQLVKEGIDWLQGSHFDPCKKGKIEVAFHGDIPHTAAPAAHEPDTPTVELIIEIKPDTNGFL